MFPKVVGRRSYGENDSRYCGVAQRVQANDLASQRSSLSKSATGIQHCAHGAPAPRRQRGHVHSDGIVIERDLVQGGKLVPRRVVVNPRIGVGEAKGRWTATQAVTLRGKWLTF